MEKSTGHRIYFYLLLSLAVILPSGFSPASTVVLPLLLIMSIANGYFKNAATRLKDPKAWLPALLYLLTVAGVFLSADKNKAVTYLSTYLPYLLPALLLIGPPLTARLQNTILRGFVLSLCVCLLACLVYGIQDIVQSGEKMILMETGSRHFKLSSYGLTRFFADWHPTYVSTFCVWAICFIISTRLYQSSVPLFTPLLSVVLFLFLLTNIILLNSIAAIIVLVCTLIALFLQYLRKKGIRTVVLTTCTVIFIIAAASAMYINPFHNEKIESLKQREFKITDKEEERNFLTIRMAKWVSHLEIVKSHPVWGVTPGDIGKERRRIYKEKGFEHLLFANFNAHNQYLEILCRFGIIGLVIFLCLLFIPFRHRQYHPLFTAVLITSCIVFLTESFLERQQGIAAFFFFYGFLLSRPVTNPEETA